MVYIIGFVRFCLTIWLIVFLDVIVHRCRSKKKGSDFSYNTLQDRDNFNNSYQYSDNQDYGEYLQTADEYWGNTGEDYSGSAEDASSYYYDDLSVYRDCDPYL